MTHRKRLAYVFAVFNALLLGGAVAAFGLGIWYDLAGRFVDFSQGVSSTVSSAVLSLLVVLSIAFPIFAIHRTAQLRAMQRDVAKAGKRTHYMARHDSLTGLGNRHTLQEALDNHQAKADPDEPLALVLIDLDHFKPINDLRGADVGDQVLIAVAKRLQELTPSGAVLTRVGGDEFAFLMPVQDAGTELAALSDRIIAAVAEAILVGNVSIAVSASCGIAHWGKGMSVNDLIGDAEQALRAAKAAGRSQYRVFDAALELSLRDEALLQADLVEAVVGNGLYCVYQPSFDVSGNHLVGAEALARWQHPKLGEVPPDRFIALADKLGLIDKLSDQLLDKACLAARDWPEDMVLSFNVTPAQFSDPHLVNRIMTVLERHNRPCHMFEVELTERALLSDEPRARILMQELVDAGLRIALDDFGTGLSSMTLLNAYPFDRLKIDRRFVRDLHRDPVNGAMTKGLVDLAHALKLDVTAEGIEHPQELAFLQSLTPITAQGYLLGRPLSGADLLDLARSDGPQPGVTQLTA